MYGSSKKILVKKLHHGESAFPLPPTADIQTLKGKRQFTLRQWPSLEYLNLEVERDESVKRGTRIESATLPTIPLPLSVNAKNYCEYNINTGVAIKCSHTSKISPSKVLPAALAQLHLTTTKCTSCISVIRHWSNSRTKAAFRFALEAGLKSLFSPQLNSSTQSPNLAQSFQMANKFST